MAVFVLRAFAIAALVVVVARVAERVGPFIGSTVLTLPLFVAPSFYFLIDVVPPEFIAESALFAFAGTGAVLAFSVGYCLAVNRFGLMLSLLAAGAAWLALALPMHLAPLNLATAFGWCLVGIVITQVARNVQTQRAPSAAARARWFPLMARAAVAGVAVATVAQAGPLLGPKLTGLVVAYPVTLTVSIWLVHRQYGAAFSAAMMKATQRTLASYSSFCLMMVLLVTRLEADLAFVLACLASVVSASVFAFLGMRARNRA